MLSKNVIRSFSSIIFILITLCFSGFAAMSSDQSALMSEDFESYTGGAVIGWGRFSSPKDQYTPANSGDGHGVCIAMKSSSGTPSASYTFTEQLAPDKIYLIRYSVRADDISNSLLVNLQSSSGSVFKTIALDNGISMFPGDQRNLKRTVCSDFYANRWYTVETWVSLDADRLWYTITNDSGIAYKATVDCITLNDIKTISFINYSKDCTVFLDDVEVLEADRASVNTLAAEGVSVPDVIAAPVKVSVSSGNIGNIFFDNERPLLKLDIKNQELNPVTELLHLSLKDFDQNEIWTADNYISLGTDGEAELICEPYVQKYGTYTFEVYNGNALLRRSELSRCVRNTEPNYETGLATHFTRSTSDISAFELIKYGGFGYARESFRWGFNSDGSIGDPRSSSRFRDYYSHCIESGIRPYALMSTSNDIYNADGEKFSTSDEALAAIEKYYREMAEMFKGEVEYYACGCELSLAANPDGTYPDGSEYAKILRAAYKGLKEGDPDAKLIAFNDLIGKSVSRTIYRQALDYMRSEGEYWFDAIGTHPYHSGAAPEVRDRSNEGNSWIDLIGYLDELIEEYGLEDKIKFANELGYCDIGKFDDEDMATYLMRNMLLNRAMANYKVMNFCSFQDLTGDSNYTDQYGMIKCWSGVDTPHSAKPQYIAFSWWNKLMNHSEFTSMDQDGEKYICRFTKNNKHITVFWDVNDSHDSALFPAYGSSASVCDMYGNVIMRAFAKDEVTLEYKSTPTYIIEENIPAMLPLSGAKILGIH